jgi:hypothetical protein
MRHSSTNDAEAIVLCDWLGLASVWCRQELNQARRLNTRPFGVLIEDPKVENMPADLAREWQLVRLGSGRDHVIMRAILPITR